MQDLKKSANVTKPTMPTKPGSTTTSLVPKDHGKTAMVVVKHILKPNHQLKKKDGKPSVAGEINGQKLTEVFGRQSKRARLAKQPPITPREGTSFGFSTPCEDPPSPAPMIRRKVEVKMSLPETEASTTTSAPTHQALQGSQSSQGLVTTWKGWARFVKPMEKAGPKISSHTTTATETKTSVQLSLKVAMQNAASQSKAMSSSSSCSTSASQLRLEGVCDDRNGHDHDGQVHGHATGEIEISATVGDTGGETLEPVGASSPPVRSSSGLEPETEPVEPKASKSEAFETTPALPPPPSTDGPSSGSDRLQDMEFTYVTAASNAAIASMADIVIYPNPNQSLSSVDHMPIVLPNLTDEDLDIIDVEPIAGRCGVVMPPEMSENSENHQTMALDSLDNAGHQTGEGDMSESSESDDIPDTTVKTMYDAFNWATNFFDRAKSVTWQKSRLTDWLIGPTG